MYTAVCSYSRLFVLDYSCAYMRNRGKLSADYVCSKRQTLYHTCNEIEILPIFRSPVQMKQYLYCTHSILFLMFLYIKQRICIAWCVVYDIYIGT